MCGIHHVAVSLPESAREHCAAEFRNAATSCAHNCIDHAQNAEHKEQVGEGKLIFSRPTAGEFSHAARVSRGTHKDSTGIVRGKDQPAARLEHSSNFSQTSRA